MHRRWLLRDVETNDNASVAEAVLDCFLCSSFDISVPKRKSMSIVNQLPFSTIQHSFLYVPNPYEAQLHNAISRRLPCRRSVHERSHSGDNLCMHLVRLPIIVHGGERTARRT